MVFSSCAIAGKQHPFNQALLRNMDSGTCHGVTMEAFYDSYGEILIEKKSASECLWAAGKELSCGLFS